jgi:hypothetical protein
MICNAIVFYNGKLHEKLDFLYRKEEEKFQKSFIIINGDVKISVEGKTTFRCVLALLRSREEYRGQLIDTNRKQREFYQDSWPSILSGYLQVIYSTRYTTAHFIPDRLQY